MVKKYIAYSEVLYFLGLAIVSLGCALMVQADLGVETVVAPAYLLYLSLSKQIPSLTFGMVSFAYEIFLMLLMMAVTRRVRVSYLFSLLAAFCSSSMLDAWTALICLRTYSGLADRGMLLLLGIVACAVGISLCLYGYFPPAPYELFVKEFASRYRWKVSRVKTCYDVASCLAAVLLSFLFFGMWQIRGIHIGTVLCALVTGTIVGWIRNFIDTHFHVRDALHLGRYFRG